MRASIHARWCWGLLATVLAAPAAHAACTYGLSPAGRNHGYGQATNLFLVTAETNCTWTPATDSPSWISIRPGWTGSGTGTVSYVVTANTNIVGRTGTVAVASQTFTIRQDPAPCEFTLVPGTRLHGYAGASTSFDVIATPGCAWVVTNTADWVTFPQSTSGTGTATVAYNVGLNTMPVWRTNEIHVATETFVLVQRPAGCIYELSPTNTTRGYAGATGLVNVIVTSDGVCSWFVENTNAWILLITNGTGLGTGSFGYQVLTNPTSIARTGTVTVWNRTFVVSQAGAPCTASLMPSSASFSAELEMRPVSVVAPLGCDWRVTNTVPWISVEPMSGSGSSNLLVTVQANAASSGRTGVVSVANQTYTVRQDGAVCTYRLSPTNRQHGYSAATNSVAVDTLSVCSWTVVNTNLWLTFTAPTGTGDSNIVYYVAANPSASDRSGVVTIGGQSFFVTQRGIGCSVSVVPSVRPHGYGSASNYITVNTSTGCNWMADTTNSWITLVTRSGTGSATPGYLVDANPIAVPRTGYIQVEEAVMTINQAAAACTNGLSASSATHTAAQEIGSVTVHSTIACPLTITNTNAWIAIISGEGSTSGMTNVVYQVDSNLTGTARSGVIAIGERNFTVNQSAVVCSYKLSPTQRAHGAGAMTNTLTINVAAPCPWSVATTNSWLLVLTNPSGIGSNVITYAVEANPSTTPRLGSLLVGGQTCIVSQQGFSCTFSISPAARSHGYSAASNFFNLVTPTGCAWVAYTTNSDWITVASGTSGTNSDAVGYTVSQNTTGLDRIGYIFADGQTFTITQAAYVCAIRLSPNSRQHGFGQATNFISINSGPGCQWSVVNTNPWINITTATEGSGSGSFGYVVYPNYGNTSRAGQIVVGEDILTISQLASTNGLAIESVSIDAQGNVILKLNGGPPGIWDIYRSSNLVDWSRIGPATNLTGKVEFPVAPVNGTNEFYRAFLP